MRKRNNVFRRSAAIDEKLFDGNVAAHLKPGADIRDVRHIITNLVCEAEPRIRSASGGTCLSCLSYIEHVGCVSERTKLRLLTARMRKLAREAQRRTRKWQRQL